MNPATHQREEALYGQALQLSTPEQRDAFLVESCAGDAELLARVRELLACDSEAEDGQFLPTVISDGARHADSAAREGEQPGTMIGHYKLREKIGEGGFGSVWVADQEEPVRRRLALKIIKLGMDTKEVIARFGQERQALAMMDHPNIAKVLDAGATEHGRPYFVMELVRGMKITDYCDDQNLSMTERIELFIQVCQAVQHAHQKGIIHRDLKPSNILVTVNDGVAVPKVIDFGVAKATQGSLVEHTIYTKFEQMVGTPLYMSPEQAGMTSLDVDTRSDIYALGVLLYEMLTGRTPIDKATLASAGMDEVRRIIREVDPPRPSARLKTLVDDELTTAAKRRHTEPAKLPAALRGDIDWIVMKCLEKDRKRRYDTANGLVQDLRRHLANEVISARPPTTAYLLSKLFRRHRIAFATGAAIAASLVIGAGVSVWQAVRATGAEREQRTLRIAADKARDAANASERQAKIEAERSQQAAAFIQSIFTGLDTAAAQGEDRHVIHGILGRAMRRVEMELTNQPEVQIEIISAIGQCFDRLDLPNYAYEGALRAVTLARVRFGEESTRTAELMTVAAARAIRGQRMKEAESHASRALELLRRTAGLEHKATLAALRELGHVFSESNRPAEAERVLREYLAPADRLLGKDDADHIAARVHLARALTDQNRPGEAEPLLREAAAGYERVAGFASRRLSSVTRALCESLVQQHKAADAEAVARSLVNRVREVEAWHPEAVQLALSLAIILTANGKDAEAGDVLREAFDNARGSFRSNFPVTAEIMQELERWYRRNGQPDKADDLPRLMAERRPPRAASGLAASLLPLEAKLRADKTDAWIALNVTARQAWLGRTEEARTTARRIVERLVNTQHPGSAEQSAKSAVVIPGADNEVLEKAAVLARRALDAGKESTLLPYFQMCVGMVEYRRGNYAEAESHLAAVHFGVINGLGTTQFYRAMIAVKQSRMEDARRLFDEGTALTPSLPTDESAPLADGGDHDTLIAWLALKEARAMLDAAK
jgi:serine/threonine protein kinase/tetratricopeptide (TPR) repeat protein